MHATRILPALFTVTLFAAAGCGSESTTTSTTSTASTASTASSSSSAATTEASTTTLVPTTVEPTTVAPTSTVVVTTSTSTSTTVPSPAQLAIWPAAGTVFDTPEAAAADFVERVLAVPPALGAFEAGDSRSGEIAVFSTGEGTGPDTGSVERSRLLLRQLGPDDGWFVLAAVHDASTVVVPEAGATVPAGPITVAGVGHGFEASMMVSAFIAGDPAPIDAEHTMAGSMEDPGDYSVTLDLTGVAPGTTVMLMVRGGTGLETDPGEFGAIAVTVG